MEELIDGGFKSILRLLGGLIRLLIWLIWDWCYETIAWYIGWPICRIVTLGTLPHESINEHEKACGITNFIVSLIGLAALAGVYIVISKLIGV